MVGFGKSSRHIQSNGRCGRKGSIMVKNIEDVQKMGKDNMEAAMTSFGASAPVKDVLKHFGYTVDNVLATAKKQLGK